MNEAPRTLQPPAVLIDADAIQQRVRELGQEIQCDYRDSPPVALCILKGAWMFFADLVRAIDLPMQCDFLSLSSYGSGTVSSGEVTRQSELPQGTEGQRVLIVEDIADSGLTLSKLHGWLLDAGARDVRTCVLLDKPSRREIAVKLDYIGFTIPNRFVVGYGIDYDEQYRNLSYIGVLDRGPVG